MHLAGHRVVSGNDVTGSQIHLAAIIPRIKFLIPKCDGVSGNHVTIHYVLGFSIILPGNF